MQLISVYRDNWSYSEKQKQLMTDFNNGFAYHCQGKLHNVHVRVPMEVKFCRRRANNLARRYVTLARE